MTRALIVDDDSEIRQLLQSYLADFGIEACVAANGVEMRAALAGSTFDIIILDLMMPGEDGLSLCRQLRGQTDVPIIMLTARGEAADRVVGLELGADDYVVKPFDARELVARINSLLRRAGTVGRCADEEPAGDQVSFEGWTLNRMTRQLISPAMVVIPLSNAEFRLLWTFIENPRRVLSRDQLMDRVRGQLSSAFDRGIDLLVSRVRQKLQDDPKNPRLLKTIRGEGYWFEAKIHR